MEGHISDERGTRASHIDAFISGLSTCCSTESSIVNETSPSIIIKRGRKPKYFSEEDRRLAKREQNRRYRDRKREELTALRRLAAMHKNDDINIEVGEESKT